MAGDGLREAAVERLARRRCIQAGHDPDVPSIGPGWLGSPYWLEWSEEAAADIADHHALLDQRGFAVVPKVATEEAQDNGHEEILSNAIIEHEDEGPFIFIGANAMQAIYAGMIAASPNPFAEGPDGQ